MLLEVVNLSSLCPKAKRLFKESLFRTSKDGICNLILRQSTWNLLFNKTDQLTRFMVCCLKHSSSACCRQLECGLKGVRGTQVSKYSKAMKNRHRKPYWHLLARCLTDLWNDFARKMSTGSLWQFGPLSAGILCTRTFFRTAFTSAVDWQCHWLSKQSAFFPRNSTCSLILKPSKTNEATETQCVKQDGVLTFGQTCRFLCSLKVEKLGVTWGQQKCLTS